MEKDEVRNLSHSSDIIIPHNKVREIHLVFVTCTSWTEYQYRQVFPDSLPHKVDVPGSSNNEM